MRSRLPVEFPCPRMMGRFRFLFSRAFFSNAVFLVFLFSFLFIFSSSSVNVSAFLCPAKKKAGFFFSTITFACICERRPRATKPTKANERSETICTCLTIYILGFFFFSLNLGLRFGGLLFSGLWFPSDRPGPHAGWLFFLFFFFSSSLSVGKGVVF